MTVALIIAVALCLLHLIGGMTNHRRDRNPRRWVMAGYVDGVPMNFVFEPVMAATAAHGVSVDMVKAAAGLLLGILLVWEVVARLRR